MAGRRVGMWLLAVGLVLTLMAYAQSFWRSEWVSVRAGGNEIYVSAYRGYLEAGNSHVIILPRAVFLVRPVRQHDNRDDFYPCCGFMWNWYVGTRTYVHAGVSFLYPAGLMAAGLWWLGRRRKVKPAFELVAGGEVKQAGV
ncbi:MAG TPA: hypothetical protein VH253_06505 [Phycisphaerae bacterium]|nr:hypothetical protein [Phycisphaerae bacterium]